MNELRKLRRKIALLEFEESIYRCNIVWHKISDFKYTATFNDLTYVITKQNDAVEFNRNDFFILDVLKNNQFYSVSYSSDFQKLSSIFYELNEDSRRDVSLRNFM